MQVRDSSRMTSQQSSCWTLSFTKQWKSSIDKWRIQFTSRSKSLRRDTLIRRIDSRESIKGTQKLLKNWRKRTRRSWDYKSWRCLVKFERVNVLDYDLKPTTNLIITQKFINIRKLKILKYRIKIDFYFRFLISLPI